jgi:PAS domain S-box-containing protein
VAEVLDALLESVADAIYLVGADGRVRFVNPAGVAVLGYDSAAELIGRDSHSTIHHSRPDGSPFPAEQCPLLNARSAGEPIRVDHDWFVRRDGSMVPVGYASAPFVTPEGNGAVVVFRDITQQLESEEALARAAAEQARAQELAASRARIVAAAAQERRRIARDLHDGAQQRLVHALLRIEQARRATPSDALDAASEEMRRAVRDLRELAAGIHPAVLTDHGLAAAIEDLTADATLPVELDLIDERFPADLEAAAYFVVSEALTNVAKHAHASSAAVRVAADGALVVTVSDDGRGGADPLRGSGLRGLADRVAALGGTLHVESGAGTTVRAEFPLASAGRAAPSGSG